MPRGFESSCTFMGNAPLLADVWKIGKRSDCEPGVVIEESLSSALLLSPVKTRCTAAGGLSVCCGVEVSRAVFCAGSACCFCVAASWLACFLAALRCFAEGSLACTVGAVASSSFASVTTPICGEFLWDEESVVVLFSLVVRGTARCSALSAVVQSTANAVRTASVSASSCVLL